MKSQLLLIVLIPVALAAQIAPATVSLEGDVVSRSTGEPIAGVRVQIQSIQTLSARTDAAGHFRFSAIPAINGILSVSGAGFNPTNQPVTVRPNEAPITVKIQMTQQAIITGRVVDQDGWPLAGARVMAAYYATVDGQRQLLPDSSAETNDLGEYRLARLRPGKYLVQADPQFLNRLWDERYSAVWHPGSPDPGEARAVELREGQTITGINIRLTPQPGVLVQGRVVWPATFQRGIGDCVLLCQQFLNGASTASYPIAADGTFAIRHIAPGRHSLLVESGADTNNLSPPRLWASMTLDVSNRDMTGITLNPVETPVRDLAGAITFEDGVKPQPCKVILRRSMASWQVSTTSENDGSFVLRGAWPGTYHLSVSCSESHLNSAFFGEKEILNREFEFDGSVPGPIQVAVGRAVFGSIGVELTDARNQPIAGATLVFLPVGTGKRWSAVTDQNGSVFSPATPGTFRVYVLEEPLRSNIVDDPEFQRAHENDFAPVKIREGANEPLKLVLRARAKIASHFVAGSQALGIWATSRILCLWTYSCWIWSTVVAARPARNAA